MKLALNKKVQILLTAAFAIFAFSFVFISSGTMDTAAACDSNPWFNDCDDDGYLADGPAGGQSDPDDINSCVADTFNQYCSQDSDGDGISDYNEGPSSYLNGCDPKPLDPACMF